jgi:hypothetical protein
MNGSICLASDVYLGRAIRIQRNILSLSLTNDLLPTMNSEAGARSYHRARRQDGPRRRREMDQSDDEMEILYT